MPNTIKLIAAVNIRLPKTKVKAGKPFDCPADLAEGYLERGSAKDPKQKLDDESVVKATGGAGTGPASGDTLTDEKVEEIRTLLGNWLNEDPDQNSDLRWTKKGKPKNNAVDAAVNFDVTVDQVNPIFAEVVAARKAAADSD